MSTDWLMTVRTAFSLPPLLALLDTPGNPAYDAELRERLITSCNARVWATKWAHADEQGIHHQVDGDGLHPVVRSGLITWQQVWDLIGPNITAANVAALHAALANENHDQFRLHLAQVAFYRQQSAAVQGDLLELLEGAHP